MITLRLPFPLSVNNLYLNLPRGVRGGRVPTKRYLAWRKAAAVEIALQRPQPIRGSVMVCAQVGKPDRRRRDLDNLQKCLLDTLVAHKLIEDDNLVESLSIAWADIKGAVIRVWPWCEERQRIRDTLRDSERSAAE